MSRLKSHFTVRSLIVLSTLIILLAVVSVRIIYVNYTAPSIPCIEHSIGDKIDGGSFSLSVVGFKVYDGNYVEQIAPGYTSYFGDQDDADSGGTNNFKLIVVDVEVTNGSTEKLRLELTSLMLQSDAWKNGISLTLLESFNEESPKELGTFESNSSKIISLPYELLSVQFKNSADWDVVVQRDYDLVLSVYPSYHLIHLGSPEEQI